MQLLHLPFLLSISVLFLQHVLEVVHVWRFAPLDYSRLLLVLRVRARFPGDSSGLLRVDSVAIIG